MIKNDTRQFSCMLFLITISFFVTVFDMFMFYLFLVGADFVVVVPCK